MLPGDLFDDSFSTVIVDKNDNLLGARVADDGQWRFPETYSVSEKVKKTTLAFEDKYFYYHPGFNPVSIVRALFLNIKERRIVSGGSTITMQTIRLYRKGRRRTIPEKFLEILMATRLELSKSKNEILSLYTSHAPYGGNVVGIEAASWRYFSVPSNQLSWAEAATLAVLPNSPSLVHPGKNRKILENKRNNLIKKLYKIGYIDSLTMVTSLKEEIPEKPLPMPVIAPHLLNRVFLTSPEKSIKTTLDVDLQKSINAMVEEHHNKQTYNEVHNASAIVIEVETGNIIAYVGNCGYPIERGHSNEVDINISPRSTGSLLKPLLYAAMLDDGKLLPKSLIADIPVNLSGFSPQNYDKQFRGAIPANLALSRSLNVPAVQLLKRYGIDRFNHLLMELGMKTLNKSSSHYGLSLILGGAEGNLEEMTNIYASMSRVLNHYTLKGYYYSNDYHSPNYLYNYKFTSDISRQPQIFSAASIWFTYQAMVEVNRPEEESGWQNFSSTRRIAWKTGTSFGYRDAWAIGTSPKFVVGVWFGNADGEGRPGLTGISASAPLMFEIFNLLEESQWFKTPVDELKPAVICRSSGYLASSYCSEKDTVKILLSGHKSPVCPFHKLIHLTNDLQFRVTSDCYQVENMKHISWFVLPAVQEWYYRKFHADYKLLPPFIDGCKQNSEKSMDLIYPGKELKIFIPRGLSGEKGRVIFEAAHSVPDIEIFWHLDDQFIATTKFIHQVEILPSPGKHTMILIDENGEELIRKFEVMEP